MTRVSDSALARYLALGQGLNLDDVRSDIEARLARSVRAACALGVHNYSVKLDGMTFIIRGDQVTTVHPPLSDTSRFHALESRD